MLRTQASLQPQIISIDLSLCQAPDVTSFSHENALSNLKVGVCSRKKAEETGKLTRKRAKKATGDEGEEAAPKKRGRAKKAKAEGVPSLFLPQRVHGRFIQPTGLQHEGN